MPQTKPYGSWLSPISADLDVTDALRRGQVRFDTADLYWTESRPAEGGREALMCRDVDGNVREVTPAPFNVRSRVNEYGGGAFVAAAGTVYFTHFEDNCIYYVEPGEAPQRLTAPNALRYADFVVDDPRGLLYCVVEDHSNPDQEERHYLAALDLDTGELRHILDEGNDFYGYIALSPDGARMAYLTWNHPNMPWDGAELWIADVEADGRLARRELVAGGWEESVFQPQFAPDGTLYFVSDRANWWNLYRWTGEAAEIVLEIEAEFGQPQWVFGMSTYGFASTSTAYCIYTRDGIWQLGMLDLESGRLSKMQTPFTYLSQLHATPEQVACIAGHAEAPAMVALYDLWDDAWTPVQQGFELTIDKGYLSVPQPVEFPTANDLTAHGLYYPPENRDFSAPEGERPPLIVKSHGGPTSATDSRLDLTIQYWTSRGFAMLDVNYGGSTGYGRDYRQRLNGQWGIVDVQDCENGAKYLAEQSLVDPERLIIRGGSAGGYTTLSALTFGDTFKAGASHYGIGDLGTLAEHTHKFESRYLDSLVGEWPAEKAVYDARSPIQHAHQLDCPVIFFQGLDDKIVPPEQSEKMYEAVRNRELPAAYIAFEGEGHGFRRKENIQRALEAELYFYSQVFGFELTEDIEPIEIENL
jgi:dipeptidyl aminopeptidase/acylaminoacyl peptidase